MELYTLVKCGLDLHGIRYIEENGAFHMTMRSGPKKWRCLITVNGDDIICCAQFPWSAGGASLNELNMLNCTCGIGCFMLNGGHVVLRYGAESMDPMEAGELAVSLLKRCGDEVCRSWNRVYSIAGVGDGL